MIMIQKRTASELIKGDKILRRPANREELAAQVLAQLNNGDPKELLTHWNDLVAKTRAVRADGVSTEELVGLWMEVLKTHNELDHAVYRKEAHHAVRAVGGLTERDDETDGIVDYTVPDLGQKLLPFLLPRKLRDAVAGDLAEDFPGYVAKFGRTYAVRWYWWELGRLCVIRLSVTAIVVSIAFWLKRKIGF